MQSLIQKSLCRQAQNFSIGQKILRNLRNIGPEMSYEKAWLDNNGYIEITILPFLLDEDVIPSPQLGLKNSIDYKPKDNNSFIEEKIHYDTAWLI